MTLIVEDGTGLADAESYISVADADIYHTNRGNSAWLAVATELEKEQLLRKATDYMTSVYRFLWQGRRFSNTQALDFPRWDVIIKDTGYSLASNVVPVQVKNSCCEFALRAIDGALMIDETQRIIREKVDVIEVEYSEFSPLQTRYAQIDAMLSVFLSTTNSICVGVVRS